MASRQSRIQRNEHRDTETLRPEVATASSPRTIANRAIWYVGGLIAIILALRFALALLGANTANAFAHLIYSISTPLVSPFFTLFGYAPTYGVSRFEGFTVLAIAVYILAAWGLTALLGITRPQD